MVKEYFSDVFRPIRAKKCAMTGHISFKSRHYAPQAPPQLGCAIWLVPGVFDHVKWLPNSTLVRSYTARACRAPIRGVVWVVLGGERWWNEVVLRLSKCRKWGSGLVGSKGWVVRW